MNDLELLSDPMTEYKAVRKFLRALPKRYKPMAMAIQSLCNLKVMTIEELCGRLIAIENDFEADDTMSTGGRLLLTEEEWAACNGAENVAVSRALAAVIGKAKAMASPSRKPKTGPYLTVAMSRRRRASVITVALKGTGKRSTEKRSVTKRRSSVRT